MEDPKSRNDMPMRQPSAYVLGFSLIELMVAVSITAVILAIAAPSFSDVVTKNRISTIAEDFFGTLAYARSEAIRRGASVCVCKSSDGAACGTGSTTWANGWIVFQNTDGDSPPVVDSGELVLKVFGALSSNYTLAASSNLTSFLCYDRYGMANTLGTFAVCGSSNETTAKAILVLRTRLRAATDTDADGIPNTEASGAVAGNIASCESP